MENKTEETIENNIFKEMQIQLDLVKLKIHLENPETCYQATETIAEMAKIEKDRQVLTDSCLIAKLLDLLNHSNTEQVALAVRALANICYENDKAAGMINENNVEKIVGLFKNPFNQESKNLINNVTVLLINLLHGNEDLPKIVLKKHDILCTIEQLLSGCLKDSNSHETFLEFLLSILSGLTEYCEETNINIPNKLLMVIVDTLQNHLDNINICSLILEILQSVIELQEENKAVLAKAGICEILYVIITKHRDTLDEKVYKQACDILVVILTDDASMDFLYDNGRGKTYQNMIAWLNLKDMELLSTSVLAIGNFARKDSNCIEMVKNGVSKKLIAILKNYNTSTEFAHVKIQHAVLSTLKNLAIPRENRTQLINEHLIEVLYPMLNQERAVIIFKLLGNIRMLIDGHEQVSMDLLSKDDFIEKLCHWCYTSEHIGVRGEVPRIFAWLILSCQSSKHFEKLVRHEDSVKCIVEMISSNHNIMQNEAYFALLHLAKKLDTNQENLERFYKILIDTPIGKHLNFALNTYRDKSWVEITCKNHLSLVKQLVKNESVVENLREFKYFKSLEDFLSYNNSEIQEMVQNILSNEKI